MSFSQQSNQADAANLFVTGLREPHGADILKTGAATELSETWSRGDVLLDRYRLDERIGHGGMGEIWKVWDLSTHTALALKQLHPSSGEQHHKRFLREWEILCSLSHPHIVRIEQWYPTQPCFTMELLEGEDLRARLRRDGPLSLDDGLELLLQLCDALQLAHQKGLIHRDLKPENIFLLDNTRSLHMKLLDFGIAIHDGDTRLTSQGGVVGTAYYVAPELLHGDEFTAAADIYSLAILSFELFIGECPTVGAGRLYDEVLRRRPQLANGQQEKELLKAIDSLYTRSIQREPAQRPSLDTWRKTLRKWGQLSTNRSIHEPTVEPTRPDKQSVESVEKQVTTPLPTTTNQTTTETTPSDDMAAGWVVWLLLVLLPLLLLGAVLYTSSQV